MNSTKVLHHLFSALNHARYACARTVAMVRVAIAAFMARLAIQRVMG